MLKLELPFHLTESARGTFFRSGPAEPRGLRKTKIVLQALSVSIETGGNTYHVISDRPPESVGAGPFCGTLWPRCVLPLTDGISLEQQMLVPDAGDAILIFWRLIGRGFEIEPETNGGRLAWAPHDRSSKIFADTDGRLIDEVTPSQAGVLPASFAFELGLHPAILIFSAEVQDGAGADPLIGAFLAPWRNNEWPLPITIGGVIWLPPNERRPMSQRPHHSLSVARRGNNCAARRPRNLS